MTTRDVLAFANCCYSAHHGGDAAGNPYMTGGSARHWLRGWKLMRKTLDLERSETKTDNTTAEGRRGAPYHPAAGSPSSSGGAE